MARRRTRTRVRTGREVATRNGTVGGGAEATVVPRVLLGAVNGVEAVASGVLKFSRDVLVSAVSGAADIGAEALTATVGGARGVISAASKMVGEIAGTAQGTFMEAYNDARHARAGMAWTALRRPPARIPP